MNIKRIFYLSTLVLLISVLFISTALYAGMNDDLINAAYRGNIAEIKELLDIGADVNAKDGWNGDTALMRAAEKGHTETVKLLIAKGADVNAIDDHGRTPFLKAADAGYRGIAKILKSAMEGKYAAPQKAPH